MAHEPYPPAYFRRSDESDDGLFYAEPRLVVHIDDYAIAAIKGYLESALPKGGIILDLMSSWRSHLPESFPKEKLVGLGMNETEMAENPQLDEWVVHDLNTTDALPFAEDSFDAVVVTVSIQYMIKPVEVFREVNRILKEGAAFHVIYSNLMFPTKAIAIWQMLDDVKRAELIATYFCAAGGWTDPQALDVSPKVEAYTDPVYVVTAMKSKHD